MRKKLMICLALLLVIPMVMLTASCAKKTTGSGDSGDRQERTAAGSDSRQEDGEYSEEVRKEEASIGSFINIDVYFDYDRSVIRSDMVPVLREKAQWLRENPDASVTIEGHCDERGTTEYNLALGDRRAQSIKTFLINSGVSASRLSKISYGEEKPVDRGHHESAWTRNRRGHFNID